MKQLSVADKSKVRKKLAAYKKAKDRAKLQLIEEARAAEQDHWPQYLWPDGTEDAWFHRKSADSDFVEKRGGFPQHVITLALTDPDWETKESVAAWLRRELKLLRDAEASPGAAPVRRAKALSRIEISEIAIELLECIAGETLVCLLQELLDIDRHRKSLAENFSQIDRAAHIEATTALQGVSLGVRGLAKQLSVSPSTVTRWRKSRAFPERVEFHKHIWGTILREDYFGQIEKISPQSTEAERFRLAFKMYAESIPLRQAGAASTSLGLATQRAGEHEVPGETDSGVALVLPPNRSKSTPKKSRKDSDSKSKSCWRARRDSNS